MLIFFRDKQGRIKRIRNYDYVACCVIMALMFIPLSNTGNIIRIVVVLLLILHILVFQPSKLGLISTNTWIILGLMILGSLLSTILVLGIEKTMDYSLWEHEMIRFGFNSILIVLVSTITIPFDFLYSSGVVILFIHTGIQLIQKSGLFDINSWIRSVYVNPDITRSHLILAEYTGNQFRSGSIFLNPNVYMVIPVIILCIILQKNILKSEKKNYCFCGVVFLSFLLAGSRTAFVVFLAIILMYVFGTKTISKKEKWTLLIIAFISAVFILPFTFDLLRSLRFFTILKGIDGSFGEKLRNLKDYMVSINPVFFISGSLGSTTIPSEQVDMEWGYVFEYFGIVGLIWYYKLIVQNPKRHDIAMAFFYNSARISIVLIGLTATVYFCMPVFPYVCLVTMANVVKTSF